MFLRLNPTNVFFVLSVKVATVAIEHVYMYMNSSIIHDEILAHRLGLVPIMANPRMFEFVGETGGEPDDVSFFGVCMYSMCFNFFFSLAHALTAVSHK